jgi:hypothetical protein
MVEVSYPIISITASSGHVEYLFDAAQHEGTNYRDWESDRIFPQIILIDLGEIQNEVNMLTIVHKHRCKPPPETYLVEGNIMKCRLYLSSDNEKFDEVTTGSWNDPAAYRTLKFPSQKLKYIKLEILESLGDKAVITELEVGKSG